MKTLEQYRLEFKQKKMLAMPISGCLVWFLLGFLGMVVETQYLGLITFIATGMIFYIGIGISKLTHENLLIKKAERNPFDNLFLSTVVMAMMGYGLVIPMAQLDQSTIPLSVGIISGLMWLPLSWTLQHPVGYIHTITRTFSLVILWYLFPGDRFVILPFAIVVIYLISIYQLYTRWQKQHQLPKTMAQNVGENG
ncbi:DUF7010 family protein [Pseudoalteromonas sp. G4]|uniref:DUF7010 family protein n=1 Tax=Pseudoalteromonas sp. G4 TaxID=2992761 RepID=UPI00237DC4AB|nr:hypothetical protein [Pseudoalteromonas sp. G4]MDE3271896.1 hypothetical protein [Pseudoalteromonas sp. G4]